MIGVVCEAQALALLNEMLGEVEQICRPESGFYLAFEEDVLCLYRAGDAHGVSIERGEIERRLSGPFMLGRACGLPGPGLRVLDAMGGLGVDALALARRGAHVHVVEQEPMLWALLVDLIRRTRASVTATLADSRELLQRGTDYDVIYLDPMFPARRKKALPGKRMQYLSELLAGATVFDPQIIPLAQQCARSRVVLKRRLKDPALLRPDWSLKGRAVRYDVYQGRLAASESSRNSQPSRRTA
jgi:16S rRNA (guanine1516-N2)-methyltransferase